MRMLTNTLAEPKSFASPERGLISNPILSTTASIAVFKISVKIINTIDKINNICSFPLIEKIKVQGITSSNSNISCLKADSLKYSHLNALKEFSEAKYIRLRPFGLFLLSNISLLIP